MVFIKFLNKVICDCLLGWINWCINPFPRSVQKDDRVKFTPIIELYGFGK